MGEYEAGKEKITVYSLQKARLHHWSGPHFFMSHLIFFSFRSTTFMVEQPFEENLVE